MRLTNILIFFSTISLSVKAVTIPIDGKNSNPQSLSTISKSLNPGDVLTLQNGPRTYQLQDVFNSQAKDNITIRSTSAIPDTIERKLGDVIKLGNNCTLENLYIRFTPDTAKTGFYFLLTGTDIGGLKVINCTFDENGEVQSGNYKRGINLKRSLKTINCKRSTFTNCTFKNVPFGDTRNPDILINNVDFENCLGYNTEINLGDNSSLRYSIFYGGDEVVGVRGENVLIEYCFFNAQLKSGEYIGFDESVKHAKNVVMRFCFLDSVEHVPVMFDGCIDCQFHHNIIVNGSYYFAFYNHQVDSLDQASGVSIFNNTIEGGALIYKENTKGLGSSNFSFKQNFVIGDGSTLSNSVSQDTISLCAYTAIKPSIEGFDVNDGTNKFNVQNAFIDSSLHYPFLKRNTVAVVDMKTYIGARKFLINFAGEPFNIGAGGFSIQDSISDLFWYDNPLTKDSGIVTLQILDKKSNKWISHVSSPMQQAGTKSTLQASGLEGDFAYFRLVFKGNKKSNFITDTTEICSVLVVPDTMKPTVEIKTQFLGKDLIFGTDFTIQWVASDNSGKVFSSIYFIDYSTNKSTLLDSNLFTSGIFTWHISEQPTLKGLIKIVCYDPSGNSISAESNTFKIVKYPTFTSKSIDTVSCIKDLNYSITFDTGNVASKPTIEYIKIPEWATITNQNTLTGKPVCQPGTDSCILLLKDASTVFDTLLLRIFRDITGTFNMNENDLNQYTRKPSICAYSNKRQADITFFICENSNVVLSVYTLNGKKVYSHSKNYSVPGLYNEKISTIIPTGFYISNLQINQKQYTIPFTMNTK